MKVKSRKTFTIICLQNLCFVNFDLVPPHGRALSKLHVNVILSSSMHPISGFPTRIHIRVSFIPCMLHDRTNNLHYPIFFSLFALRYCLPVLSRRPSTLFSQHPRSVILFSVWRVAAFFVGRFENTPLKRDHSHHHSSLLSAEYKCSVSSPACVESYPITLLDWPLRLQEVGSTRISRKSAPAASPPPPSRRYHRYSFIVADELLPES